MNIDQVIVILLEIVRRSLNARLKIESVFYEDLYERYWSRLSGDCREHICDELDIDESKCQPDFFVNFFMNKTLGNDWPVKIFRGLSVYMYEDFNIHLHVAHEIVDDIESEYGGGLEAAQEKLDELKPGIDIMDTVYKIRDDYMERANNFLAPIVYEYYESIKPDRQLTDKWIAYKNSRKQ